MELLNHLVITLPMLICLGWALFFLIRCATRNGEARVTQILLIFYCITTILYIDHWLYFSGVPSFAGEWSYKVVNLCVYPVYYAYLRALTRAKRTYEVPLLLLPALVVAVLDPIDYFARICFAAQVVWVWYRGYRLLKQTVRRLDNTYSDDRSRLLHPMHILLQLFGVTAAVSMVLNIIGREFFTNGLSVSIPAVVMTVLLYGLGYVAAHTTLPQETITSEEAQAQETTIEETDALISRIATVLREQKLYASPDITIQDLAAAVHSNRTYVSQCINRRTGLSFSQYIARYRVENAQQILRENTHITDHDAIVKAMTLSGFSSDQTFYRVFKEITGETPLQYRHKYLQ